MRRRALAALTATALAATLAATACTPIVRLDRRDPTPSGSAGPGAIDWQRCSAEARKLNPNLPRTYIAECATVKVPQDWNAATAGNSAGAKTFDISLMRIRSERQRDRIGAILTNPGGPGGSGVDFLPYLAQQVPELLERFDLVGFDPRGVSRSAPVDCVSDADLDATFGYEPDPVSDADYQGLVALTRRIGDACAAKYGDTLRLYSTEQTARDIDAIRAAMGEDKLNYLGFSYGTLLGAVYAQLFPKTIRAMVLDGAVDPRQSPGTGSEGQALGFERAFTNFVAWCKKTPADCPISSDPRAAVLAALDQARTNPAKLSGGRAATAGWVFYAIVSSLYSQEAWPYLALAISDLRKGNPRVAFLLADSYAEREPDGSYKNLFDANNAINCADSDTYPSVDEIRALQAQWRAKYPLFGAPLAVGLLNCSLWPAGKDTYPVGPAVGAPPIVVVGTKGDPATPYESTAKLAEMLGVGVVVTWDGEGHTAYPNTDCIRNAIDSYFIDLKVPAKDLTCPAE